MQHDSSGSSGSSPLQNFVGNLVYVTETPIPMQKVTKNSTIDVICALFFRGCARLCAYAFHNQACTESRKKLGSLWLRGGKKSQTSAAAAGKLACIELQKPHTPYQAGSNTSQKPKKIKTTFKN